MCILMCIKKLNTWYIHTVEIFIRLLQLIYVVSISVGSQKFENKNVNNMEWIIIYFWVEFRHSTHNALKIPRIVGNGVS